MTLIPNIKDAWRFASNQFAAVGGAVWLVWVSLPPDTQAAVVGALGLDPGKWMPLVGAVGVIIARITAQPSLHQAGPKPQVNPGV